MSLKFIKTILALVITLSSASSSYAHWAVAEEEQLNWVSDPISSDNSGFDTAEPKLDVFIDSLLVDDKKKSEIKKLAVHCKKFKLNDSTCSKVLIIASILFGPEKNLIQHIDQCIQDGLPRSLCVGTSLSRVQAWNSFEIPVSHLTYLKAYEPTTALIPLLEGLALLEKGQIKLSADYFIDACNLGQRFACNLLVNGNTKRNLALLMSSTGCPSTNITNRTHSEWNSRDQSVFVQNLERCRSKYPNSPCLKLFKKTGTRSYRALCSKNHNIF